MLVDVGAGPIRPTEAPQGVTGSLRGEEGNGVEASKVWEPQHQAVQ